MKLIVLLLVLLVRRLELRWPEWLRDLHRVARVQSWLAQTSGLDQWADLPAWMVRVALPALLLALLMLVLHGWFWGLAGWLAGAALLLWLLGPESEFRHLDELLLHGRMNDGERLAALASEHFAAEGKPADDGYFSQLLLRVLHRDAGHLFGTVFYLMTLGYGVAFFYVINRWLAAHPEAAGHQTARVVDAALYWLPSRLLIVVMALVGDYRRVMESVEGRMLQIEDNSRLLEDAAIAALDINGEPDPDNTLTGFDMLEALQSLLLRCLALWLILAALWILLL